MSEWDRNPERLDGLADSFSTSESLDANAADTRDLPLAPGKLPLTAVAASVFGEPGVGIAPGKLPLTALQGVPLPAAITGAVGPCKVSRTAGLAVQRKATSATDEAYVLDSIREALRGIDGPGDPLPFLETIQKAFGRHDLSGVRAHSGEVACQASEALGAEAYTVGSDIAFSKRPSLHTAAHEAAHVIQQRGEQVPGGVGKTGDRWEQHADAVADRVVRGESAEDLLAPLGDRQTATPVVQRKESPSPTGAEDSSVGATPGPSFKDFEPEDIEMVKAAIKVALRGVADAISVLKGAKSQPVPRLGSYFKIIGTSKADKAAIDTLLANFNVIAGALLGHERLVFDAEQTGPFFNLGVIFGKEIPAYVHSTTRPEGDEEGEVQLVVPRLREMNRLQQARLILHEVAHRYANCDLDVYLSEGTVGRLTTEEAIRNADSYAFFALPPPNRTGIRLNVGDFNAPSGDRSD